MRQGSHSRNEIRKHLLPFFENLVDEVHRARQEKASMQSEATIARRGDALVAEAIGQWLRGFDRDDKHLNIDGARYYRLKDPVEKTYATSRGKVRISRHIYRPSGVHNGAIACPVELSVGMVQGQWTPGCAVSMAYTAQELPERNAAKLASKLGAMNYSASSFKRVTRALGAGWEKDRDLFEEATIEAVQIPETAECLAISVDRVSLPMAEDEGVNYRMAYCGAVTMYDGQGEPLKTLRYGRMPAEGSSCLREQMRWDVEALLKRRPDLELICLSDGAAEMCNILDEEFPNAVRYIDYYHLVEKLAAAITAYANHRPLSKTKDEVIASWQFRLLNEDDAIDTIEKTIK